MSQDIAYEMRERARALGLSMAEVCRRADTAYSTYNRIKSGRTKGGNCITIQKLISVIEASEAEVDNYPNTAENCEKRTEF